MLDSVYDVKKIIIVCKKGDDFQNFAKILNNFDNRINIINSNILFQALNFLFKLKSFITNDFNDEDSFLDIFFKGYYQTSKYLKKNDLNYSVLNEKDLIDINQIKNDICTVHIRGGDYLTGESIYWNLSGNYYTNSIKNVCSYSPKTKFIFISDDWKHAECIVKELIKKSIIKEPILFKNSYYLTDFLMMVKSNFLICSNSTFSIQAAINGHSKHVIVPKNWFRDYKRNLVFIEQLYPPIWIKISDRLS